MKLVVNGCSMTYGANLGLDHDDSLRTAQTWGGHLGRLMGATEVVNLALNCGSNQRILRTTLDYLRNQTWESLCETRVIVQWTHGMRWEHYCQTEQDLLERTSGEPGRDLSDLPIVPQRWARVIVTSRGGWEHESPSIAGYSPEELCGLRFLTWTDQEKVYRDWECYLAFQGMMNMFGIHHSWFWHMLGWGQPQSLSDLAQAHLPWIDSGDPSLAQCHIDRLPCSHPSLRGHQELAEYIWARIQGAMPKV